MPNFSNLLDESVIFDPLTADSRQGVLRALSRSLAEKADLDPRLVCEAVTERERLGSTGVGDGVAIPHVRLAGIQKPIGAFARLTVPVDFDAVDDRYCDLVFMLLASEREGSDHLRALAQVSRAFRQAQFREMLRAEQNAGDLATLLLTPTTTGAAA
jgi:PTS system nitrogen regulatory IIA component